VFRIAPRDARATTPVEKASIHRYFPPMFLKHDGTQRPAWRWKASATVVLVVINITAYLFQLKVLSDLFTAQYLELSLGGFLHGYVWQLLSYQFLHGSWPHVLLNSWALFVFGRAVERAIGKMRFVSLYFLSGIVGGLFQMLAAFLWPYYFDAPVVGASAGVMGIIATFAMLFPNQQLIMLLFFVIPLKLRAQSLLVIILLMTGLGIAFYNSRITMLLGGNVAHFAHLGGILTGMAITRFYFFRSLHSHFVDETS
jgi:membrane associated rhomboid family serine protease